MRYVVEGTTRGAQERLDACEHPVEKLHQLDAYHESEGYVAARRGVQACLYLEGSDDQVLATSL